MPSDEFRNKIVKNPNLGVSFFQWCALPPATIQSILSSDDLSCTEFIAADAALVWITAKCGIKYNKASPSIRNTIAEPILCNLNVSYGNEILKCLRPQGLGLFYNLALMLWLKRLDLTCMALEFDDYEYPSDDEDPSGSFFITRARKKTQKRVTGYSYGTVLPPEVVDLVPGEYSIEEMCVYCSGFDDDDVHGDDNEVCTMKLKIVVDPENPARPLAVSGRCYPGDGSVCHVVEHCLLDYQLLYDNNEEFISLYCTSYITLKEFFQKMKQSNHHTIKLAIFYAAVKINPQLPVLLPE